MHKKTVLRREKDFSKMAGVANMNSHPHPPAIPSPLLSHRADVFQMRLSKRKTWSGCHVSRPDRDRLDFRRCRNHPGIGNRPKVSKLIEHLVHYPPKTICECALYSQTGKHPTVATLRATKKILFLIGIMAIASNSFCEEQDSMQIPFCGLNEDFWSLLLLLSKVHKLVKPDFKPQDERE